MTAEEQRARKARQYNLDYALRGPSEVSPQYLARKLNCETNYISQLRNGFRPITFDTARLIEEAIGATRLSLDSPPDGSPPSVSRITDTELQELIASDVKEKCKAHGKPTKGELYEAMLCLCVLDARARGYSKGRVQYIVEEFLK